MSLYTYFNYTHFKVYANGWLTNDADTSSLRCKTANIECKIERDKVLHKVWGGIVKWQSVTKWAPECDNSGLRELQFRHQSMTIPLRDLNTPPSSTLVMGSWDQHTCHYNHQKSDCREKENWLSFRPDISIFCSLNHERSSMETPQRCQAD